MAFLYLVRHGTAEAGWGAALDPGLGEEGRAQAREAAEVLAPRGPLAIVTSPLRRAMETAAPLSKLWERVPLVDARVGEIPSPTLELRGRAAWLREVMARRWRDLDADLQAWRWRVLEALLSWREDAVVFTHFVAINVAYGRATGDDRVLCFWPANGSITVLEATGSSLLLVGQGTQGTGAIL